MCIINYGLQIYAWDVCRSFEISVLLKIHVFVQTNFGNAKLVAMEVNFDS